MDGLTTSSTEPVTPPRPAGVRAGPLALAMGSTAVATLPVFLFGGLAVLVRADLGFSQTLLGATAAVFWAAATVTSAVGGRLAERVDPRRALALTGFAGAVVFAGIGVVSQSWIQLVAFMAVGGVLVAFGQPAANLLIAEAMPPHRNGVAFGIKQSSIPLATLLGGASVPLIAVRLGWRWGFVAAAVPALVLGVAALRGAGTARRQATAGHARPLRPLLALAVVAGFGAGAGNAMAAFYVDSSVSGGFDVGLAGTLLAFGGAASIVFRVGLGWRADRRGGSDLGVIAVLLLIGAAAFAAIPLATSPATLAAVTFVAFAGGWSWNGLLLRSVVVGYPRAPAAATGITQTGVYAGAVAGPLCFGVLADRVSYVTAWRVTALWLLVAGGMAAWLRLRGASEAAGV